jgi:tRNA threonylcarbamoyl adenosine modification protein YeaZ
MLTLGIDTSTVVCAGLADEQQVLAGRRVGDSRSHVEQLIPLVKALLAEIDADFADITGIVAGLGPGPFTGLRVGVAAAATLGEALGVPVRGVCSLDVIAAQAVASRPGELDLAAGDFLVASDARRQELYWAGYSPTGRRESGPFVTSPDQLPALPTYGPGAERFPLAGAAQHLDLDAGVLALRGMELPAQPGLDPLYLRRPDADVPNKPKSVLPAVRIGRRKE